MATSWKKSLAAIAMGLVLASQVMAGGWPSKTDFDSWASGRVSIYNGNTTLVGTCGKMTEIGSPQANTIWIFGQWHCEAEYLEAIAETVGIAFRQKYPETSTLSVHVWSNDQRKLATKRF